jgi:hypothetical protein
MAQFRTIERWDLGQPAYMLLSLSALDRAQPFVHSFPRSGLGSCILTGDPEVCEVATEAQAKAYATDNLVAIPYSLAARLYELNHTVMSLRGEVAEHQSLIRDASLSIDHSDCEDEEAKLILEIETAERHEGGGSIAYFTLDPRFLVVEKTWLDRHVVEAG